MKKLLAFCMAMLLVGCSAAPSSSVAASSSVASDSSAAVSSSAATSSSAKGNLADLNEIAVDKDGDTVTVLLPPGFANGSTEKEFDIDQYVKENDFTSATLEADGSLRIVMSKAAHKKLMQDMTTLTATTLEGLANNPETPYIKKISFEDDFSKVTILVEKEGYESAFDVTPLNIALNIGFYQLMNGEESPIIIDVVDELTQEVLRSATYPENK